MRLADGLNGESLGTSQPMQVFLFWVFNILEESTRQVDLFGMQRLSVMLERVSPSEEISPWLSPSHATMNCCLEKQIMGCDDPKMPRCRLEHLSTIFPEMFIRLWSLGARLKIPWPARIWALD